MGMTKRGWIGLAGVAGVIGVCAWVWIGSRPGIEFEQVAIPLPAGNHIANGLKINDNGLVAGAIQSDEKVYRLFLWDWATGHSETIDFPLVVRNLMVIDLNNAGHIVGRYRGDAPLPGTKAGFPLKPDSNYSFYYEHTAGYRMIEPPAVDTIACVHAMNERDQAVGHWMVKTSKGKSRNRLFLWDPTAGTSDPNLYGVPEDINDSGHVVGYDGVKGLPFFWPAEGELRYPGFSKSDAFGSFRINNEDVGIITIGYEESTIYRWTPKEGLRKLEHYSNRDFSVAGLNDRGQFVLLGYQDQYIFDWYLRSHSTALLWDPQHGIIPLREIQYDTMKGTSPEHSFDINNRGWIVEAGSDLPDKPTERVMLWIPKGQRQTKK